MILQLDNIYKDYITGKMVVPVLKDDHGNCSSRVIMDQDF